MTEAVFAGASAATVKLRRTGAALLLGPLLAVGASAAGDLTAGAYCPLPEPGEAPSCLVPAQAEYGEFFRGVASGAPSEAQLRRVEAEVSAGSGAENPFLALNALSYGYYVMAQAAAADPGSDPFVVARLERWNDLLARAYAVSGEDQAFRAAVHSAALDLRNRAPAMGLRCIDPDGAAARCDSTESVLRGLSQRRDRAGIRGTLLRLIGRIFPDAAEPVEGVAGE